MHKDAKIFVAGHKGLVGSAICRKLKDLGYKNIITQDRSECDLTNQNQVFEFFRVNKPEYVFLAAAKVGGILANNKYPADFIYQNLLIQTNVIEASYKFEVNRLLFLGSSCIYPKSCPQPIKEEYLLTGPLEPTNRPYAIAKIAGIEQCWAYNRQYGTKFIAAMPTNVFGPNDNYNLETSHVLPALLKKVIDAKNNNSPHITAWGTGTPKREFIYSDDLADACVFILNLEDKIYNSLLSEKSAPLINVGTGEDISIKDLLDLIKNIAGYNGETIWDKAKPNGTCRKVLDVSKLNNLGWKPQVSFKHGVEMTLGSFKVITEVFY
jgi:GDP-L-fucose synthase